MARLVDLGAPYGTVEFPDDYSDEQIVAEYDGLEDARKRAADRARMQTVRQVEINEAAQESRIPERIALGLDASVGAAPIAAGNVLRSLVPTRADIEASGQRAPAGFTDEELQPGVGGFPVNLGLNAPTLRYFGRQLVDSGLRRQRAAREEAEQLGGGVSGAIAGSLAETAGVSAQTLPFAAFGMGPVAVAAGLQQYGLTKEQFKEQLQQRNPNLSDDEAYRIADGPAAITGLATGALTRAFGGVERLVNRIVSGQLRVGGVKQLLREANLAGGRELPEEYFDQLAQGFTEKAYINPDKPVSEIFNEAAMGGLAGYALGVGTGAAVQAPLAVASQVEEAARESRVRRESREQSRERIRRVIAQREREANASQVGTQPPPTGQEEAVRQEADESVRVRLPQESRVATVPGTEVANVIPTATTVVTPPATQTTQTVPPGNVVATPAIPTGPVAAIPAPAATTAVVGIEEAPRSPGRALVEQAIADVAARWQNAPEIVVVEDVGQLPAEVRADAPMGLNLESTPGVTDRAGRVWLVAGNITDPAHATRVIMEEAVGHLGVESALGDNFAGFMQEVAERHAATPLGQQVRSAYGNDPVTVGREIVAKLAQEPSADSTLWQRIVAAVRGWVRQVFSIDVSDNDLRVLLSRARRVVETGPARSFAAQPAARFAAQDSPSASTAFFPARGKVIAATSNPGLTPSQIQEAEDLAAVQSSMVTQGMIGWLMGTPADAVERRAHGILDYLLDRAYLSPTPRLLSSFPEGTTEEERTKELAGSLQLAHHAVDRSVANKIYADIDVLQGLINDAVAKIGKLTQAQHRANYLTALFNSLTSRHRQYIADLTAAGPASANLEAQWRAALNRAQERLNEQDASPTALRNGLSAIARTIPEALLNAPGTTNQTVIDWVVQNGALFNVVGQATRDWMTIDDGTGTPALQTYAQLIPDLQTLKDILNNEAAVASDINAFETWFRNNAATGNVSSKEYAEKYFKFRTGRDRALKIVAASEKEIDRLDERIRANIMARDRLDTMMSDPGYREAVREAAAKADIVIRALYDPNDANAPAVGLINRDRIAGKWTLRGPLTGVDFVVDLHPTTGQEAENRTNLSAWMSEARAWATGNTDSNPLLADEYNRLAEYIERHLMSPSLDPKAGFTMTRVRIPFTNVRASVDPFDWITAGAGGIGYPIHTIRDVIERIGGRTVREAFRDAAMLDTVMRKLEAIEANPEFGRAAQTQAILKAMASHGWDSEQSQRWDEEIAEPVFASGQNKLSPIYEVGDVVVGSDAKLTREDVAAIRLMKQHGDAIIAVAPHSIQDKLAELGISRRAIGNGRYTSHRIQAHWAKKFVDDWNSVPDDAAKARLLISQEAFRRVVLGYLAEFNPEFGKMDPASRDKSPLFLIYRRLADTEKSGVEKFRTWDEVITFIADEMVQRGVSPDFATAQATARTTLFSEIKEFILHYENDVLNYTNKDIYGGVPPAVVSAVGTRNAFTTPRGRLRAPSTFYSYSTASEARHRHHLGNLRSLLNLKVLQSMAEATASMEAKKAEMEERINQLSRGGMSKGAARKQVQKESVAERALGNIRYDYRELLTALQAVEQAAKEVRRYELASTDHYQHAGVVAANNVFSSVKSSLLSSLQALTTNFWSGGILGPALVHWQAGQWGRAMGDVVLQPALMTKALMKRVSALVADNPVMAGLLKKHAPLWDEIAEAVMKAAADWRRIQHIAQSSGMVTPYNLRKVLDNMAALKRSGGRVVHDDPHRVAEWVNAALSLPGVRHVTEGGKAIFPRVFDNAINYMLVINFDRETEFLKNVGWAAFKARETAAAGTGTDWKDLTNPANVLKPGDLGFKTNKALEVYQQLFIPLGSLDTVLLDYYERTQGMTEEQREDEPLLNPDDHAALALQYAAKSNVSTETNRPYSMKGKGSDGVWRNVVGTFMGWAINMMHQLSKGMQTHSKDPKAPAIWNAMIGLTTIIVLMAAVGAWNWEVGDELSELFYGVSSARVQLGNIQGIGDWHTSLLYLMQAIVNTLPMIGSSIGGLFGVAYTGRGNPFDMTSLSPHIGFVAGIYNTVRRIKQTGDATLPLFDFTRQWIPMSKIFINPMPGIRGLVDQQNAVRSMNASAPPGTEIKWGKRGGGDARYGPANDEIQKLIASAYEAAAHGGEISDVQARMSAAVAAYVAAGRSQPDAVKALSSALSAKEPIRVLTGREMTPEEERRWVARMTTGQKADYDRATAAWRILGAVTGKDLNMVTTKGQGVGGGGGRIPSRAIDLGGGPLRAASLAGTIGTGGTLPGGFGPRRRGIRRRGLRPTRRRRFGGPKSRRRLGPRIGGRTTRRRIGTRRRRRYALA